MSRMLALVVAASLLSLSACSQSGEETSQPAAAPAAQTSMAPKAAQPAEPTVAPDSASVPAMAEKSTEATTKPTETASAAMLTREQAMALATRGGCLACHRIDSKLIGPAWKDVGAKYKDAPGAAAIIASHIKAGGSFGWKLGVMPPRGGGQLSDAGIDSLAKFIAALK